MRRKKSQQKSLFYSRLLSVKHLALTMAFTILAFCYFGQPSSAFSQSFEGEPGFGGQGSGSPGGAQGMSREEMREQRRRNRAANGGGQNGGGQFGNRGGEFRGERGGPGQHRGKGNGGRMQKVGNFLDFMNSLIDSVQDPYKAAGIAAMGIKEHYKKQGQVALAVPELEQILAETTDRGMRNVLLFGVRQIYEETKNSEKFLEINRQIIKENAAAKSAK